MARDLFKKNKEVVVGGHTRRSKIGPANLVEHSKDLFTSASIKFIAVHELKYSVWDSFSQAGRR